MLRVGTEYGVNNLFEIFSINRLNTVSLQKTGDGIQEPLINIISMYIANSIEIICLHVILIQKLITKTKLDKCLFLTVFLYFISLLLNGGRSVIVPFIIHLFYLIIILVDKRFFKIIKHNKMKIGILTVFLVSIFILVGSLRNKNNTNINDSIEIIDLQNSLATYTASPIIGFDIYIKKGLGEYNYFGQHLFKGIYDIIRHFGVDFERDKKHQENYIYKNIESNAYIGMWHWIKDFRLLGAFIYSMILGGIFGFIHVLERKNIIRLDNIIECYVIAMLYWALIMLFFGDMFRYFFSLDFVYILFIIYIILKLKFVNFQYINLNNN